jgi:ankyrin repeat protein
MRVKLLLVSLLLPGLVLVGSADSDLRLIDAVKNRNIETVRSLLKQSVDVNASQGDGATALHWAAYWDDVDTTDLLLGAGARVNAADDHGITPLWLACSNGASANVIDLLMKAGADPNVAHSSGETALMSAARTGNLAAVTRLLAAHAKVGAQERTRGQTALMWAAAQGHADVTQALVTGGADVHARSRARHLLVNSTGNADYMGVMDVEQGGFTPLLFTARGGDVATAKILIAAGADVNDAAADGTSALVVATHSGHSALALLLLEHGADPNAIGSGYTALQIAIRQGDVEVVKALLGRGADPNARLIKPTPARRLSDDVALARPLVGTTPLWLAADFGETEIVRILTAAGADPRLTANDGSTPLIASIGRNEARALEIVKYLAERGANVNAADESGNTALHKAAANGFDRLVQLLADSGATLDARNALGQTPLMLTRPRRSAQGVVEHKTTAELLRTLGAKE